MWRRCHNSKCNLNRGDGKCRRLNIDGIIEFETDNRFQVYCCRECVRDDKHGDWWRVEPSKSQRAERRKINNILFGK